MFQNIISKIIDSIFVLYFETTNNNKQNVFFIVKIKQNIVHNWTDNPATQTHNQNVEIIYLDVINFSINISA